MQSHLEYPVPSQTDSSVPATVDTFPIQRLPDAILSRVIDVGSWADNNFDFTYRGWKGDTKPRQKQFVSIASQVCCRWRQIAQWQGHPDRWHMRMMFTMDENGPDLSHEFSQFRRGLRASDGCDLIVRLVSWTEEDPDSDFESDDAAVVSMQLFVHVIRMLLPYLQQVLVLGVEVTQTDPLHFLFGVLHRWTNTSCLTSLSILYVGDVGTGTRDLPSSLSDYQLLGLPRNKNEDDMLSHSFPPTLAHLYLESVSLPKNLALPYGLTHLTITGAISFTDSQSRVDFHTLIPHPSQLTSLHLALRNKAAPSTPFLLDGLLTLQMEVYLVSFWDWSQIIYAKSLRSLYVLVSDDDPDVVSPPSEIVQSSLPLAPTLLNVISPPGALRATLSCLAITNLVTMSISFMASASTGQDNRGIEMYPERLSCDKEIVFPLVETLMIASNGKPWSRALEWAAFPVLVKRALRIAARDTQTEYWNQARSRRILLRYVYQAQASDLSLAPV